MLEVGGCYKYLGNSRIPPSCEHRNSTMTKPPINNEQDQTTSHQPSIHTPPSFKLPGREHTQPHRIADPEPASKQRFPRCQCCLDPSRRLGRGELETPLHMTRYSPCQQCLLDTGSQYLTSRRTQGSRKDTIPYPQASQHQQDKQEPRSGLSLFIKTVWTDNERPVQLGLEASTH